MAVILIVEDSDNVVPLEIALASLSGIRTLVASDGREALALLESNRSELAAVITDLDLPYVDGYQVIAAIRAQLPFARLPIIVISGNSHPEAQNRARQLGADAFFLKPHSPLEILKTLEGLLHAS